MNRLEWQRREETLKGQGNISERNTDAKGDLIGDFFSYKHASSDSAGKILCFFSLNIGLKIHLLKKGLIHF